jgi:ring-1,2-phenylacetyl-CoA epoxidase subunit PaaC
LTFNLLQYCLHLADNSLVLGHRNSEWTGHGPILEQDIALSNISLDLIGQARNFYQYAADLRNDGSTEDTLAYFREADEFLNCLLVEQENGDWGKTIMRQFLFSSYQLLVYEDMLASKDERLSAIAGKSIKEVKYHLRWSSEWVIRLGLGTEESQRRMTNALNELWRYTEELYTPANYEGTFNPKIRESWKERAFDILQQAHLSPPNDTTMVFGGKIGQHSDHLSALLNEMQYMQRTYPGMEW